MKTAVFGRPQVFYTVQCAIENFNPGDLVSLGLKNNHSTRQCVASSSPLIPHSYLKISKLWPHTLLSHKHTPTYQHTLLYTHALLHPLWLMPLQPPSLTLTLTMSGIAGTMALRT